MLIVCGKGKKVGGKRESERKAILEKKRRNCKRVKRDQKGGIGATRN